MTKTKSDKSTDTSSQIIREIERFYSYFSSVKLKNVKLVRAGID